MLYRIDELETRAQIQALNEYIIHWCFYEWDETKRNCSIDDLFYASNVNGCLYDEYGTLQDKNMDEFWNVHELTQSEIDYLKWDVNYQRYNDTSVPDDISNEEVEEFFKDTSFVLGDFGCEDLEELERYRRIG